MEEFCFRIKATPPEAANTDLKLTIPNKLSPQTDNTLRVAESGSPTTGTTLEYQLVDRDGTTTKLANTDGSITASDVAGAIKGHPLSEDKAQLIVRQKSERGDILTEKKDKIAIAYDELVDHADCLLTATVKQQGATPDKDGDEYQICQANGEVEIKIAMTPACGTLKSAFMLTKDMDLDDLKKFTGLEKPEDFGCEYMNLHCEYPESGELTCYDCEGNAWTDCKEDSLDEDGIRFTRCDTPPTVYNRRFRSCAIQLEEGNSINGLVHPGEKDACQPETFDAGNCPDTTAECMEAYLEPEGMLKDACALPDKYCRSHEIKNDAENSFDRSVSEVNKKLANKDYVKVTYNTQNNEIIFKVKPTIKSGGEFYLDPYVIS